MGKKGRENMQKNGQVFSFFKFKEKPTGFICQDVRELTVMGRETTEIVFKNL